MESTFYPLVVIIQYVPGYIFSDSAVLNLSNTKKIPRELGDANKKNCQMSAGSVHHHHILHLQYQHRLQYHQH